MDPPEVRRRNSGARFVPCRPNNLFYCILLDIWETKNDFSGKHSRRLIYLCLEDFLDVQLQMGKHNVDLYLRHSQLYTYKIHCL